MINLLPKENLVDIKKEYIRRLLVVMGFFSVAVILMGVILLIPSYIFTNDQKKNFSRQSEYEKQRLYATEAEDVVSSVKDLNSKVDLLQTNKNKRELDDIVQDIISIKGDLISISSFAFTKGSGKEPADKMVIVGTSKTRNELLAFVERLNSKFSNGGAEVPVSSLLKEKDVDFTVTFKLN